MGVRVKFAALYHNQKKIAELEDVEVSVMMNGEEIIATEGWLTVSDGAITSKLTATAIIPTSGTTPDMFMPLLNRDDVQLAVPLFGKILKFDPSRPMSINVSSTTKSGKTSGKFEWVSGKPNV
jgi:hypothetical protein